MTTGALPLGRVRPLLAAALEPVADSDPDVLASYEDAIEPPALFLQWQNPWLEPRPAATAGRTFGPCLWLARIAVTCVAGRAMPTPNIELLERLVTFTIERLRGDDSYQWPPATVGWPRTTPWGDIRYLVADVNYELVVTTTQNGGAPDG